MIEIYAAGFVTLIAGSSIRAAVLVLAVAIALRAFGRLSAASRAALWFVVVIACGVLPLFALFVPSMEVSLPVESRWIAANDYSTARPLVDSGAGSAGFIPVWTLILGAYLLGSAYFLTTFLLQVKRVFALRQGQVAIDAAHSLACLREVRDSMDLCRRPGLLHLPNIRTPMTWGVIRPWIAMPAESADWSGDRLRNALTHEIAHIARFDWLRLCVMKMLLAMQWFNPLVWYCVRKCEYETERACDEVVLRNGALPSEYAQQLLETMQTHAGAVLAHAGPAFGRYRFADRLRALLNRTDREIVMTRVQMSLVTVCVLTMSGLLAACQVATVQPDVELQITSESAVANEVLEIAPAGITITELMEFDDYVRITGRAQANSEISEFMRAIDQSSLGAPSLGLITMENERSEFMLDIHRR